MSAVGTIAATYAEAGTTTWSYTREDTWEGMNSNDPDGNCDVDGILAAVAQAKACTDKPTIIKVKTVIGYGSTKAGSHKVHGAPLGDEDIAVVKETFGFDPSAKFTVPEDVYSHFRQVKAKGAAAKSSWDAAMSGYRAAFPEQASELVSIASTEKP